MKPAKLAPLGAVVLATAVHAQTHYYVDARMDCDGRAPCFATITQGMAAAGTGDTVAVFPGIYYESLDLEGEAGVTLRNHVDRYAELSCSAAPRPRRVELTGGIVLSDDNAALRIVNLNIGRSISVFGDARGATISGNRIRGMSLAVCSLEVVHNAFTADLDILAAGTGCIISENSFDDADLVLDELAVITGLTVRENFFNRGSMSLQTDIMRDSVFIENRLNGGSIVIEGRSVQDNVVEANGISGGGGIVLHGRQSGTSGNRITGNDVRGSAAAGILVDIAREILPEFSASGANEISGNTALDSAGCDIEDNSHPDIDNDWSGNIFVTACGAADG